MKPIIYRTVGWRTLVIVLLLMTGTVGCDSDLITETGGVLPDEQALGQVGSAMRSNLSFSGRGEVILTVGEEGDEPETVLADELFYSLAQPAQTETKVTLSIGTELTEEFLAEVDRINAKIDEVNRTMPFAHATKLRVPALFSTGNVQFEAGSLVIPVGKAASQTVKLTLSNKGILDTDSIYLLPVVVEQTDIEGQNHRQVLQYIVRVYPKFGKHIESQSMPGEAVPLDTEFLTVFYLNTESYQPLLADVYNYAKTNNTTFQIEIVRTIGNIVNLKPATVGYDAAAGRALLNPGPDLRYVLEHVDKYIRPLQHRGRKVCVCIEGGGKGIGFCNMTDVQIADFTTQVKDLIERYKLDGINLWDEGAGYGKPGMLPVNTASYPKLIKSLREAMPDKLLTLVDKDEPTEYFYDIEKCGGIEVGNYIDYAWHGYFDEMERVQVIEPWEQDHPHSDYTRRPIAGLSPERYGNVNMPCYGSNTPFEIERLTSKQVVDWKLSGRKKNSIIVFGEDLTFNEQGPYEGQPIAMFSYINHVADKGSIWGENPWIPGEWDVQSGEYYYMFERPNKYYKYLMKDW